MPRAARAYLSIGHSSRQFFIAAIFAPTFIDARNREAAFAILDGRHFS